MKTLISLVCGATLVALTVPVTARASPADLTGAKSLYASASYEEALAELAKVDAAGWDEQVDEYRALCLLALGRTSEAEQALEHLIRLKPLHSLAKDQMSPRVVSLFDTVRARTLPVVSRDLYSKAKSAYDAQRFTDAIPQFRLLVELLSDAGFLERNPTLADMKELGEGFLKLAEAKGTDAKPADAKRADARPTDAKPTDAKPVDAKPTAPGAAVPASTPSPRPPPAPGPAPVPVVGPRIFTSVDRDVTPPVEISRSMPPWVPGNPAAGQRTLRGVLELVTDTNGAVESATLVTPLSPFYDRNLLAATKQWKFRPAMQGSQPVKYRWQMEIVLSPR